MLLSQVRVQQLPILRGRRQPKRSMSNSMASMVRSLESALCCTVKGSINEELARICHEIGKKHEQKLRPAQAQGRRLPMAFPIHVIPWLAVIEKLHTLLPTDSTDVAKSGDSAAKARAELKDVGADVKYFRHVQCFNKDEVKFIVHVEQLSISHEVFVIFKQYLKIRKKMVPQGVAPRNKKERDLLRILNKVFLLEIPKSDD